MPTWALVATLCTALILIGVLLTLGTQWIDRKLFRPWFAIHLEARRKRGAIDDHERQIRETESQEHGRVRADLRWDAYHLGKDMQLYGESDNDPAMRLFGLLICEISMTLVNRKLVTRRRGVNRLRDIVDFSLPYLLPEDRWWRAEEFDRELKRVIEWKEVKDRGRQKR